MTPTVVIDAVFGLAALALAIIDPFGSATWARWLVAGLGVFSLDMFALKAWGRSKVAT